MMKFNIPTEKRTIIKVIGVGGGGGNAVAHMYNEGIVGVEFAICNTDAQAMLHSPIETKISLGPNLTEGRGAGSKPETGKEACIESIDEIRAFLAKDTKMLFVTAGMGGGTGTGAAPIIAKAAKEMGILTVGIVTLPFQFEGLRRKRQALEGLESLKKNVDAILVISNDKLKEMFGGHTLSSAFSSADDVLTTAAKSIAEIITIPGLINVDFEDVNYVMKESGVALMGYGEASGTDRARIAIKTALSSPLLEDNDIRGAQHILLNVSSGTAEVTMDEITEITDFVQEEAGYGTDIIWGNCSHKELGDRLTVTIIATGFETGVKKDLIVKETSVDVPLEDGFEGISNVSNVFEISSNSKVIDYEIDDIVAAKPTVMPGYNSVTDRKNMEAEKKYLEAEAARRKDLRSKGISLDSMENKEEIETVPAYKRRGVVIDDEDVPTPVVKGHIATTYFVDTEGTVVQTGNSFLRERID